MESHQVTVVGKSKVCVYSMWHHSVHKAQKEGKVSQRDNTGSRYLGPRLLGNVFTIWFYTMCWILYCYKGTV